MSWGQLVAIRDEARQIAAENKTKPIVECPVCGALLDRRGALFNCPMGHFQQLGEARGPESV